MNPNDSRIPSDSKDSRFRTFPLDLSVDKLYGKYMKSIVDVTKENLNQLKFGVKFKKSN